MNSLSEYENNNNIRRICVLTKIDIMEQDTDVKDILLNKKITNELGYIGVVNRRNISNEEIFAEEKNFFDTNEIYENLPKDIVGNHSLIKKLLKYILK